MNKQTKQLEGATRWLKLHDKLKDGVRVWFDNCGSEPHWVTSYKEAIKDQTLNAILPWKAQDTTELYLFMYNEPSDASDWSKLVDAYESAKRDSDARSIFYRSGPLWEVLIARTRLAYAELNLAIHNLNVES